MKILIIEDDRIIARQLKIELEKWQYQVATVQDFHQVMEEFKAWDPQLVLLDIGLPAFNGYHWCQEIRKISTLPIIIISSRSDNMDQVMAIQMGADDYLVKPIDMGLTLAKIQALLRRSYDFNTGVHHHSYQGLTLSLGESKLIYLDQSVELTFTQMQIIETLIMAQGNFVKREVIMDKCWEQSNFIDDNTLSVNVSRLRKRMAEIGLDNGIMTKKNIGYALKVPDET